jgi:predicted nuclease of predicted toxin-antitoxin system
VKFLLDENLSYLHAATLRGRGHDAVTVVEMGLGGADDSVVRATALNSKRILVTLDGDFANVQRYPPAGTPGVIRLRLHPATEQPIDEAIRRVVARLADISIAGKLAVVDQARIRIRS